MPRTVTQIQFPTPIPKARRVAAYARVSSDKDTMLHSLAAQVDYYSTYIRHHPGWAYVGVYADEAKTGTRDSRENFQRMLADCRAGKIDHIITKSVSRFSRNTVILLETIRELKGLGISVYFEEQSIDTSTADGELMLSILASYAQEESLSASENQKWRVRRNFEQGIPWRFFMLGYRGENGKLRILSEESFGTIWMEKELPPLSSDSTRKGMPPKVAASFTRVLWTGSCATTPIPEISFSRPNFVRTI